MPLITYYYVGNLGDPSQHIIRGVKHVKATMPFWDRHQGVCVNVCVCMCMCVHVCVSQEGGRGRASCGVAWRQGKLGCLCQRQ